MRPSTIPSNHHHWNLCCYHLSRVWMGFMMHWMFSRLKNWAAAFSSVFSVIPSCSSVGCKLWCSELCAMNLTVSRKKICRPAEFPFSICSYTLVSKSFIKSPIVFGIKFDQVFVKVSALTLLHAVATESRASLILKQLWNPRGPKSLLIICCMKSCL